MKASYEWLGDKGEISGHVVFDAGSGGSVVEIDEQVADSAIADGFPLRKMQPALPEKELEHNGNL